MRFSDLSIHFINSTKLVGYREFFEEAIKQEKNHYFIDSLIDRLLLDLDKNFSYSNEEFEQLKNSYNPKHKNDFESERIFVKNRLITIKQEYKFNDQYIEILSTFYLFYTSIDYLNKFWFLRPAFYLSKQLVIELLKIDSSLEEILYNSNRLPLTDLIYQNDSDYEYKILDSSRIFKLKDALNKVELSGEYEIKNCLNFKTLLTDYSSDNHLIILKYIL